MRNLVQDGTVVSFIAPDNVEPGDLVNIGSIVGVAVRAAKSGEEVPLRLEGVFKGLPVTAGDTYSPGTIVYYNPATKKLTTDDGSGSNLRVGVAVGYQGQFRLNGSF